MKLGSYPALSLADARDAASHALVDVGKGIDPVGVKQDAAKRAEIDTFANVDAQFVLRYAKQHNKSWK